MKKISAVVPTIGRINYLDIAIESILNQSKQFDEIIVFDNSVDQNLKHISKYGQNSSLKFIQSGTQLNAIDSWNKAVGYSKYDYVTIIGDDDVLLPNYCESIHKLLELSDVGILKAYLIDENGTRKRSLIYSTEKTISDKEFRTARFFNKISLFVPGIVFKKELFFKVGGFKNTYIYGFAYSDELLLAELSILSGNIAISEEFCWNYRTHSEQIGVLKDISIYIDKAMQYIDLYEKSLILLGVNCKDIYPYFSRQEYVDKVCGGIVLYGTYCGKNRNLFTLLSNLLRYFIFDKRLSLKSRLRTILLSIKAFIGSSKIGKLIKKIRNS